MFQNKIQFLYLIENATLFYLVYYGAYHKNVCQFSIFKFMLLWRLKLWWCDPWTWWPLMTNLMAFDMAALSWCFILTCIKLCLLLFFLFSSLALNSLIQIFKLIVTFFLTVCYRNYFNRRMDHLEAVANIRFSLLVSATPEVVCSCKLNSAWQAKSARRCRSMPAERWRSFVWDLPI